ncbi:MAG: capsular biosynthesis protein [Granulosicoccus sp.]|nr:capsular biosynthesis protein [Granulosicoccus sp.]
MTGNSNTTTPCNTVRLHAKALLLQGPVGPFFSRIADDLTCRGFEVFKINFNGGDRLFFNGQRTIEYTGTVEQWSVYLEQFLADEKITRLYLFGDCRIYHQIARSVAKAMGVRVFVFEEGYIRPNFITLEEDGVNGHSKMIDQRLELDQPPSPFHEVSGNRFSFYASASYSMLYYLASAVYQRRFRHYRHHRPIGWFSEGALWLRSSYRKFRCHRQQQRTLQQLTSQFNGRYFLCPLQVHCDMQVLVHSNYESIEQFVNEVLSSFARHAPLDQAIVFKHHPLDRGYTDYGQIISFLTERLGLQGRVFYVHDLCLPTLLKGACGSVMINSTVGMSSLFHGTPVKVMGKAIYDRAELTSQLSLDEFWSRPGYVDSQAFEKFRNYLIANNQLNGSLYLKLHERGSTGVFWSTRLILEHSAAADIQNLKHSIPDLRLVAGRDVGGVDDQRTRGNQDNPRKAA